MTDIGHRLEVVREAGEIGLGLLECETPPVSWYTAEDDNGLPILEADDRVWDAWTQIHDIVDSFDDDSAVEVSEYRDESVPSIGVFARREVDGEEFATVGALYEADGNCVIDIEFNVEDGWRATINDYQENLSALEMGRKIAAAEIAVLANELQSPAETLDYWMPSRLYNGRQSRWAADRKVSPQTVSDRVRAAKEKLDMEES